jgi:hypothetical protein
MKGTVAQCDLRACGHADGLAEVVNLLSDRTQPDVTLLLVLDTPETLAVHALAYEELWRSRRVGKLLCMLVGPVTAPGVLEIPGSFGPDGDSGLIWVGDTDGVDWRLAGPAIAMAHPERRDETGLGTLLGALSTPEVFVKTLSLIGGIPGQIASPGLNVFELSANQTMFLGALSGCIRSVLDPAPVEMAAAGWATTDREQTWAINTIRCTAVPGGRLAAARDRCVTEAEGLQEAADRLNTAVALYGTGQAGDLALTATVRTGTELSACRDTVQELVSSPPAERAERFREWGVRPVPATGTEPGDATSAIIASLRAGEPLPQIMRWLRGYERKLRSSSDLTVSEQIERACPQALPSRFTDPAPMPDPEPWLVGAGAVAVAAAALGHGFGIIAGTVVALAWLGMLGLTVVRGPAGRLTHCRGTLIASGIGALTGLACGTILARVLQLPTAAGGIGFAAGVCVVAMATTWSWIARTRRWGDSLRAGDVGTAAAELTDVVLTAAGHDWSADEKHQDAVITARASLDGATAALRAYKAKIDNDLSRYPGPYYSRQEFDDYVRRVLCLLVAEAIDSVRHRLGTSSPQEYEAGARSAVTELLAEWEQHVERSGALDPPGFADGENMSDGALGHDDIAEISKILLTDPLGTMWQLCRPGDIRLLDTGAPTVSAVRFAPKAIPLEDRQTFPAETEWIGSASRAGVLRLVPLRRGTISRTWLTSDEPVNTEPVSTEEMP